MFILQSKNGDDMKLSRQNISTCLEMKINSYPLNGQEVMLENGYKLRRRIKLITDSDFV